MDPQLQASIYQRLESDRAIDEDWSVPSSSPPARPPRARQGPRNPSPPIPQPLLSSPPPNRIPLAPIWRPLPSRAFGAARTRVVLSRACHHHPYELSPTADELVSWVEDTHRVVNACKETSSIPSS